jgi:hypothetical protein
MVDAVTQLDPDDPTRDEPSELTQAELFRFHLTLDHDNDPSTAPIESDNINNLLGVFRNDIRFGRGLLGEIYISSKATGEVYLVTNTLPVTSNPSGDFNGDGIINGRDFLVWQRNFGRNGELTIADGDANLNGVVDELDLAVWEKQFGRQTDDLAANSTVPEPSSLLVLTSCVGCLCTGRRVANRTFVI